MIGMKKYYEVLTVGDVSIEMDEVLEMTSLSSRMMIRVFEEGTAYPSAYSQTHAQHLQNRLRWKECLQLPFTGQKKLGFEVYCDYQPQQKDQQKQMKEKEVFLKGVFYVTDLKKPKIESCHVYSPQGEKKGLLRWEVRRATQEKIEVIQQVIEKEKPLIPQDLIGIIKVYEASLEITNPIFNKKHHPNIVLALNFGSQSWIGGQEAGLKWKFSEVKIEYFPESSQTITAELFQEEVCILKGSINCESIRKMKRYVKQPVSMLNKHAIKFGTLTLELRYIDKQELQNLLLTPSHNINSPGIRQMPKTHTRNDRFSIKHIQKRKNYSFSRYKQLNYMHHSAILQPKTARFPNNKPNSPYVSYIDPEKLSDFSPKSNKGWDMSRGCKFDFTRQYRGNPGVGTYRLPSIWGENAPR